MPITLIYIRDIMRKIGKMAMGFINGLMAQFMKGTLKTISGMMRDWWSTPMERQLSLSGKMDIRSKKYIPKKNKTTDATETKVKIQEQSLILKVKSKTRNCKKDQLANKTAKMILAFISKLWSFFKTVICTCSSNKHGLNDIEWYFNF